MISQRLGLMVPVRFCFRVDQPLFTQRDVFSRSSGYPVGDGLVSRTGRLLAAAVLIEDWMTYFARPAGLKTVAISLCLYASRGLISRSQCIK